MSLSECVKGLIAEGALPKAQGERAEKIYSRHFARLKHEKSMMAAAAEASEATLKHLRGEAKAAKRAKISTAMAQIRALEDMKTYRGGAMVDGLYDPKSLIALGVWDDRARYMDLEGQHDALRATYHSTLDALLKDNRANVLGRVRSAPLEEDILAAAYGEKIDNLNASEMAKAAQDVAEMARQQFNEAGGHIAKRDDWRWVQDHSDDKLMAAGYDQWKADVTGVDARGVPILKASAMLDHETGLPFDAAGFEPVLRKMYQDVTTDGRASMQIGGQNGKALFNAHADERFFVFTDSKTHLWYAERYGRTGVVEGMMQHLDRMARDNAAIQRFGANPDATIKHLGDTLIQQAAKKVGFAPYKRKAWYDPRKFFPDAQDRAYQAAVNISDIYDVYMGKHPNMIPKRRLVGEGFEAFRSFQVSAKLGGAYITAAPGDAATAAVTRAFNGIAAWTDIPDYLRLIAPTDDSLEQRQMLIRHGAIAADWAQSGAQVNRLLGEQFQGEIGRRSAEATLRLSVLTKHTDIRRAMFVKSMNAAVADERGLAFDALPKKFAEGLDRYGIGAAEWDVLRATPLVEDLGTMWFNPMRIEDAALRDSYLRMVHTEKRFAVPEVDLRTKTTLNTNLRKGSWVGESLRTMFLFKGFGLTLMNTHGRRAFGRGGISGAGFLAAYAIRMGILTTIAGAVGIQISNFLQGKDLEPMDDLSFAGRAQARGGGFSLFGDFLKSSENRYGGGVAQTIAGPGAQSVQNFGDATFGNVMKLMRGEETDFGTDFVAIMRQEVPVASSLWWLRPAYDRLLVEEVDAFANEEYEDDRQRKIKKAANDGKPYYAPPGTSPDEWRAPDFANALNGQVPDEE